jgi:hypothetical protein
MATARTIISLALESMNRLSPGEAIDPDLAASCLRRLNSIADDWSVGRDMAPQDVIATGSVTGASLTLGSSPFASVSPGTEPIHLQADGMPMESITIQQYNNITDKTQTGRPSVWVWDGSSKVFLFPAALASSISIVTRQPFTQFADLDTSYTLTQGYQGAFAASVAVAMAPALLGRVPPDLVRAERRALFNLPKNVRPAMLGSDPLSDRAFGSILRGWQ